MTEANPRIPAGHAIAAIRPESTVYFRDSWTATETAKLKKYSIAFPNSNR